MQQITITDTSYTQWVEQLSLRYQLLYSQANGILPQLVVKSDNTILPQPVTDEVLYTTSVIDWLRILKIRQNKQYITYTLPI